MKRAWLTGLLLTAVLSTGSAFIPNPDQIIFRRGDANTDGRVDITDALFVAGYLFLGGPEPPCRNQADANNDGVVDVSDSIHLLSWLFSDGEEPPRPGPHGEVCTLDDEPYPGCRVSPCP
jgi:hypothetical protein